MNIIQHSRPNIPNPTSVKYKSKRCPFTNWASPSLKKKTVNSINQPPQPFLQDLLNRVTNGIRVKMYKKCKERTLQQPARDHTIRINSTSLLQPLCYKLSPSIQAIEQGNFTRNKKKESHESVQCLICPKPQPKQFSF